jgi:hypothetical protein
MKKINRRDFLKFSGTGLIGMTLGGISLRVNAQEQVDLEDPAAKALQYTHESKVEGSYCENCLYIQGETGPEWLPCAIFPGKTVNAKGWCTAWQKKP